jgi:hypothetical protein
LEALEARLANTVQGLEEVNMLTETCLGAYNLSDSLLEVQKYVKYEYKSPKTPDETELIVLDKEFVTNILNVIDDLREGESTVGRILDRLTNLVDQVSNEDTLYEIEEVFQGTLEEDDDDR